jgi:gamma-glutamylcyclotransferase (GGCT)/AIG2-like uncharacterized protein YtfP
MKRIAVYGSLKYGFYNWKAFELGKPITTGGIEGAMYLVGGSYPHLFEPEFTDDENVKEHSVEIYDVEESVYNSIASMELGAGYYIKSVDIEGDDGETYTCDIFFTNKDVGSRSIPLDEYTKETVPRAWVLEEVIK